MDGREGMIRCGGGRVYARSLGMGPTTLVMPVSCGLSHDFYAALFAPLERLMHLVYFDPEGTGRSTSLPPGWDPARLIDEAEAVRSWAGEKSLILIGHDSGAFLSIAYALEHPTRVSALVLVSPYASHTRADALSQSRLHAHPNWSSYCSRIEEIDEVGLPVEDRARAVFRERRMVDMYDYAEHYVLMAAAASRSSFNPAMYDDADTDLKDELHLITAPTLIVSGTADTIRPPEEGRLIARLLPYVRLIELDRSGHFPFTEQPREFQQAVREFLRDLELGAN